MWKDKLIKWLGGVSIERHLKSAPIYYEKGYIDALQYAIKLYEDCYKTDSMYHRLIEHYNERLKKLRNYDTRKRTC